VTISLRASLCFSCKHFHQGIGTCDAFPDGVPDLIFYGGDHHEPVEGDHGIQYERSPGPDAAELFKLWKDWTPNP
jgi:hypothetical protein